MGHTQNCLFVKSLRKRSNPGCHRYSDENRVKIINEVTCKDDIGEINDEKEERLVKIVDKNDDVFKCWKNFLKGAEECCKRFAFCSIKTLIVN